MPLEFIQNSRILIVDDQEPNVLLIKRILERNGYRQFRTITDSTTVIEEFKTYQPDLLLLDLMMPKVDGYSVLTQIRECIRGDAYLPILVITADVSREAKQKALALGAKDFLTKPIDATEAALRIYNLLETRSLYRRIQLYNAQLEQIVDSRTRELTEAHRRLAILDEAKSDFLRLISHEFRTPLNGLLGTSELILDELGSKPDSGELREMLELSRCRILSILDDALLLTQIEVEGQKFACQPISLREALTQALEEAADFANSRQVLLQPAPAELGIVLGNVALLVKALRALVEAAVKFSKPSDTIALMRDNTIDDSPTLIIDGPSGWLPESAITKFFDVFSLSEVSTPAGNLGLGPSVANRILALFGGCVTVTNRDPSGIRLTVSCRPAHHAFEMLEAGPLWTKGSF
jgi:two-component system sensor histidine kinase/response regulator